MASFVDDPDIEWFYLDENGEQSDAKTIDELKKFRRYMNNTTQSAQKSRWFATARQVVSGKAQTTFDKFIQLKMKSCSDLCISWFDPPAMLRGNCLSSPLCVVL